MLVLNQSKETVSPKNGENIEMLVCLICMGTQDSTLIDINHHYQINFAVRVERLRKLCGGWMKNHIITA